MHQNKNNKIVDGIVKNETFSKEVLYLRSISKTNSLKYSSLKLIGVIALAVVVMTGLSSVGSTISYFNDEEISVGNRLVADPLSFSVQVASSTSVQVDLSGGDVMVVPVMTPDADSELIQYSVSVVVTGGDSSLCSAIHLMSTWPFPYDGPLTALNTGTSTDTGSWALNFSVPDSSVFSNTSCTVDLVYRGWNADVPFGKGYNDTQKFSVTFFVPEVKIAPVEQSVVQEIVSTPDPAPPPVSGVGIEATSTPTPEAVPEPVPAPSPEPAPEAVVEIPPALEPTPEPAPEVSSPPIETSPADTTSTQ